ncbi:MAG: hypothetical protein JST00_32595 [Deltaproteobacteria bacterium]|nr:hypothetical protein [Deltaproteobacteria bacterium]
MKREVIAAALGSIVALLVVPACSRQDPPPSPRATPPASTETSEAAPSSSTTTPPSPDASSRTTHHPLADFCNTRPCAYEAFRSRAVKYTPCTRGEAGKCGAIRWIHIQAVDGTETGYFDAKNQMIGAETSSDMGYRAVYGESPPCNREPTEHLCGLKRGQRSE